MTKQKTLNIVVGVLLLVVGVLFILCGKFSNIIDILLGVACCVGAVVLTAKGLVSNKKILGATVILAAALLALGITLFIFESIGAFITYVLNVALITVGTVILADTIFHFIKKRNTAINVVELIIAIALITVGVVALCVEVNGLVFYFSGAVICFAGLIVLIASLINFKKYTAVEQKPSNSTSSTSGKKKSK